MQDPRTIGGQHRLTEDAPSALSDSVKVLYIAGWGRSGSTILGRILGQVEGFFSVGELRYIWDRGLIEDRLCGCGAPFSSCVVWGEVTSRILNTTNRMDAQELVALRQRGIRTRHISLAPTRRGLKARTAQMGGYLEALENLYGTLREVSGSRVIVDTSKFPSYGYVLQSTPNIELYVLHLVRDPRAVAHSWKARKKLRLDRSGGPVVTMTPHGTIESSLVWDEWNLAIERALRDDPERYMLLRYEDFVEAPRSSVEKVLRFLGEESPRTPFEDERRVALEVSHAFSGNPDRFVNGTIDIKDNEEWKRDMSTARQIAVTALTWPGFVRYGYPLRPQRSPV